MDAVAQSMSSWGFLAVQLLGLLSMAAARLEVGRWAIVVFQAIFFACLLAIGGLTMVAVGVGSGSWISSGVTLSLMAVGAVLDLGPGHVGDGI